MFITGTSLNLQVPLCNISLFEVQKFHSSPKPPILTHHKAKVLCHSTQWSSAFKTCHYEFTMSKQVSALFHSTLPLSGRNAQTQPMLAPGVFFSSAVLTQYFWHPLGHILPHEQPVLIQSWGALLQSLSSSNSKQYESLKTS